MKIINPEAIHISEKEFIDTINAELDWEVIENMLLEKHKFAMQDEVDYKKGDLVVYHDQIAYKFDFDIKVALSVVFGRDGRCLEISTSGDARLESGPDSLSDSFIDSRGDPAKYDYDDSHNDAMVHDDILKNREQAGQYNDSGDASEFKTQDISKMAANIADMISDINKGDD